MAFEIPFGVKPTVAKANVDERYGTYSSTSEANASIPQAIRSKGLTVGIIEDNSVVEYWYKSGITDNDLVIKIASSEGSAYVPPIFITDIKAPVGYNTIVTKALYPNDEVVTGFSSTNNANQLITVEWDRGVQGYVGEPEFNNGQDGFISVWDLTPTNIERIGSTTRLTIDVSLPNSNLINYRYAGVEYTILGSNMVKPVIQSVVFGSYPDLPSGFGLPVGTKQTHLKGNDNITVTVTANVPFQSVVLINAGLAGATQANSPIFIPPLDTTHSFNLKVASGRSAGTQTLQLKIIDDNGTESDVFTSVAQNYDDSISDMGTPNITFSNGKNALKTINGSNLANVYTSDIQFLDLFTVSSTDGKIQFSGIVNDGSWEATLTVTGQNTYNVSTNNAQIKGLNISNGKTVTVPFRINIADVIPTITLDSVYPLISGGVDVQNIPVSWNGQFVTITGMSTTATGVILGAKPSNRATSHSIPVTSVSGSALHSATPQNISLTVENDSGLTSSLNRQFAVQGFALKTFTLNYPAITQDIGVNIVSVEQVTLSAQIDGQNPFSIGTTRVNTIPANASEYRINNSREIEFFAGLADFGYNQAGKTITFTIKED